MRAQVILEEFGKWLNESANATMADRDRFFAAAFNESNALIAAGSNLKARAAGRSRARHSAALAERAGMTAA